MKMFIYTRMIKTITVIVLSFFVYTFILYEPLIGITKLIDETKQIQQIIKKIDKFVLPYKFGRIVEGNYTSSDCLIIYIQDLHCHPEVQKNIYEIIKLFDNKYNISKIFVEGAPEGKIDIKILSSIPDREIKNMTLDSLLNKGLISAAEYYSIVNNKDKLYGVEKWDTYLSNYNRIKNIILNKDKYIKISNVLNYKIDLLKRKYLSKKIKKMEKLLSQEKKHNPAEYYLVIENLCKKLDIGINFYPNLKKYIRMVKLNKELNFRHLAKELRYYFKELQNIIPYGIYSALTEKMKDSNKLEEYYLSLLTVAKEYTPDIKYKYPNLDKFFEYIQLNYSINPIYLTIEERILIRNILNLFSTKQLDKEILFLSDMAQHLKNFLDLKITYEEFKYFSKNVDKFKILLKKYFEDYEIQDVINFVNDEEIYKFYETNIDRDRIFYEIVKNNINFANREKQVNNSEKNYIDVLTKLKDFKEINIIVTGGFHFNLTEMLNKNGISYITIVPNVTREFDDTIYERILIGKIDIKDFVISSFAPMLLSLGVVPETKEWIILTMFASGILQGKPQNEILEVVNKWIKDNNIKTEVSLNLTDEGRYIVKVDNKTYEFVIKGKKIKEIKVLDEPKSEKKFSLLNRIIIGGLTATISGVIGSFLFSTPFGWIVGGILSSYFFVHSYYIIRAGLEKAPPVGLIDEFADLSSEQKILTDRFTPAKIVDGKIYINTSLMARLPYWLQRIIYNHELRHLNLTKKISPLIEEIFVSLSEWFITFRKEKTSKIFEKKKETERLQALGVDIKKFINIVANQIKYRNPLLANFLLDSAISLSDKIVVLFEGEDGKMVLSDEESKNRYGKFLDILFKEAKFNSELISLVDGEVKFNIKVSKNPMLIQKEALALATLKVNRRTSEVTLYIHEVFLESLKNKSPPQQQNLLRLLLLHEIEEYTYLKNNPTKTSEDFHKKLQQDNSPLIELSRFAESIIEESNKKIYSIPEGLKTIEENPPKMVICDIGGALTPDTHTTIKDSHSNVLRSLEALLKLGIPLVLLTTGSIERTYRDVLNHISQDLYKNVIVYAENGAYVYRGDELLEKEVFSKEEIKEIIRILNYLRYNIGIENISNIREVKEDSGKIVLELSSQEESVARDVFEKVREELNKNNLKFTVWWSEGKVTVAKKSKLDAVKNILSKGISPDEVIYIGNSFKEGQADSEIPISGIRCIDVGSNQQDIWKILKKIAVLNSIKYIYKIENLDKDKDLAILYSRFKIGHKKTVEKITDLLKNKILNTLPEVKNQPKNWVILAYESREVDRSIMLAAKKIAEDLDIEFIPIKRKPKEITVTYQDLSEEERINRAKESITVEREINAKNVIFLDDLVVTGTFLEEVVLQLYQKGVDKIYPFCVAYLSSEPALEKSLNRIAAEIEILTELAKGEIFTTKFIEVLFEIEEWKFKEILDELSELQKIRLLLYFVARKYSFKPQRENKIKILLDEIKNEDYKEILSKLILGDKEEKIKKSDIVARLIKERKISTKKELEDLINEINKNIEVLSGESNLELTVNSLKGIIKNISHTINPKNNAEKITRKMVINNKNYSWLQQNAPELFAKTFVHVSPGFKPSPDFLRVFSDPEMRIRVANGHQTGGLEPLVTEELVQLTDMGMNAIGVSLLYQYSPWQKEDGSIELRPVDYTEAINKGRLIYIGKVVVPMYGKEEAVKVYAAAFNAPKTNKKAVVLFLSHPEITREIYPGDYSLREKQMLLLGRGTLAILKEINEGRPEFRQKILSLGLTFSEIEPVIVQLNEALTAFAHPKVVKDSFTDDEFLNSLIYGFTTHTPVEAGLQTMPIESEKFIGLNPYLWQYGIIRKGRIDLTKICLTLCDTVNGVSKEHAEVTQRRLYPEFKGLILGIVNGINLAHWQLKEFQPLVGQQPTAENLKKMYELHKEVKQRFADWIYAKTNIKLDTSRLFSVEARRKTDFKSVDTFIRAMRDPQLREKFLSTGVVQIFLGKQHIEDKWGLARVRELKALSEGRIIEVDNYGNEREIARDERLIGSIVFVENFNVAEAPIVFQGADVLCMLSQLETEASATGYMKGLVNAIPTIATKTGGPLEHIRDSENGFFVRFYDDNGRPLPIGVIDVLVRAWEVYKSSLSEINKGNFDVSWTKIMWNALQTTPNVDITTTVKRYIVEMWLPAYRTKLQIIDRIKKDEKNGLWMATKTQIACSLPIFSLRNSKINYGIGKLTDLLEVYRTMLKPAGVSTILLLPHFTPLGESPYSSVSPYAINELFIDWIKESEELKLPKTVIEQLKEKLSLAEQEFIDYQLVRQIEFESAKVVYTHFLSRKKSAEFKKFISENYFWLKNYSSFMAATKILGRTPQSVQEIESVKNLNPGVFETYQGLYEYMQYVAYKQLKKVIKELHKEGAKIMFDIPFFRGKSSVDVLYHSQYFDVNKRSPYIWGQRWNDLILYNWDELAKDGYSLFINPILHWMRFGFDGLRLDALHFAYPLTHLGNNIEQSGNEKGDDFVSTLITQIRAINSQAIILAESFEGIDRHIRDKYDIYTVMNVDWFDTESLKKETKNNKKGWFQISSHDSPRPHNNHQLVKKYNINHTEESFKEFFRQVLTSGAEFVSFVIGDQFGEEKPVKEEIQAEDGTMRSLWRYRIPLASKRNFDITEFIKILIDITEKRTDEGYFMQGFLVGKNLNLPQGKSLEVLSRLRQVGIQNFKLLYDDGKKELPFGNINAPHLHCLLVAYQWIKFMGEKGKWALWHHSYHTDFFTKFFSILNDAGITRDNLPEVYSYVEHLQRMASATTDVDQKAKLTIQLFGFIQGLLEDILRQEYLYSIGRSDMQHINQEYHDVFSKLLVSADSFILRDKDGSVKILAGYPWFDQSWGRDSFISLAGLLIVTRRFEEAKQLFRFYAKYQSNDGIIPNRIWPDGKAEYNTADGSLWFVEALYRYYEVTEDIEFVKEMLPTITKIIQRYTAESGTIYMDRDYLVVVPAQYTWMDTKYTPRNGKPVEIQALLYNALKIVAEFYRIVGDKKKSNEYIELSNKVRTSILERFFEKRDYPYDVLDGDEHKDAIRPNALILLSLTHTEDLLPKELKEKIIEVVERDLLTPYGLRTLSPKDTKYRGYYDTLSDIETKDPAYHQGTVWPWLIKEYVRAKISVLKDRPYKEVIEQLKLKINNFLYFVRSNTTLPEVFSGNAPYSQGGCVSQAWSVAAMLEILDLLTKEYAKPLLDTQGFESISVERIKRLLSAG